MSVIYDFGQSFHAHYARIIEEDDEPQVLSYSNLIHDSSSFSIMCVYCAYLVLSYKKQRRPVLLCLSDII
jgi:hypothetical protein